MSTDLKFSKITEPAAFYQQIESIVQDFNIGYIDAVVHYCEKNEIEIETAASLIKGNFRFKSQIQNEGETLNCLPKTSKLPI